MRKRQEGKEEKREKKEQVRVRGKRKGCEEAIDEEGKFGLHEEWSLSLGGPQNERGLTAL